MRSGAVWRSMVGGRLTAVGGQWGVGASLPCAPPHVPRSLYNNAPSRVSEFKPQGSKFPSLEPVNVKTQVRRTEGDHPAEDTPRAGPHGLTVSAQPVANRRGLDHVVCGRRRLVARVVKDADGVTANNRTPQTLHWTDGLPGGSPSTRPRSALPRG